MSIRVTVLGSTGMLGHAVVAKLSADPRFELRQHDRVASTHNLDALLRDMDNDLHEVDYVINCIGVIWQAQNPNRLEALETNAVFPWRLQDRCVAHGTRLIHVSTDCVFSGNRGMYTEHDVPDPIDDYGTSKALGEPRGSMVLRTSVIGRELKTKRSLLEWAIANRGNTVYGYANHAWNGVTSLELSRICSQIMAEDLYQPGVHHVFSTSVTKHDLLCQLNEALGLDLAVKRTMLTPSVNRLLSTNKPLCSKLNIPDISTMIGDLKQESPHGQR